MSHNSLQAKNVAAVRDILNSVDVPKWMRAEFRGHAGYHSGNSLEEKHMQEAEDCDARGASALSGTAIQQRSLHLQ